MPFIICIISSTFCRSWGGRFCFKTSIIRSRSPEEKFMPSLLARSEAFFKEEAISPGAEAEGEVLWARFILSLIHI